MVWVSVCRVKTEEEEEEESLVSEGLMKQNQWEAGRCDVGCQWLGKEEQGRRGQGEGEAEWRVEGVEGGKARE